MKQIIGAQNSSCNSHLSDNDVLLIYRNYCLKLLSDIFDSFDQLSSSSDITLNIEPRALLPYRLLETIRAFLVTYFIPCYQHYDCPAWRGCPARPRSSEPCQCK